VQWLQDPNKRNDYNLNNVRREASRHFRRNKIEYLKAEIDELEAKSRMKNIRDLYRGINDFGKCYQPRANIVKDEKCDLVTDSHNILPTWMNQYSQIINVHCVNNVTHTEIHRAERLVPFLSAFEFEMDIEKLKQNKYLSIDQIPAQLIKAGGRTIRSEIHKIITLASRFTTGLRSRIFWL